jgi:hypothetical protein
MIRREKTPKTDPTDPKDLFYTGDVDIDRVQKKKKMCRLPQ